MIRKIVLVLTALLGLLLFWQIVTFPRVSKLAETNPSTTAFMERRQQELRGAGQDDQLEHSWVPYDQISPHLRSAVIVSEDSRFFEHRGVDTEELEKILREAWDNKELGRGGSTITQQLAKNLYLTPSRNPLRKIKEILIAKRMEQVLEKRRILELYLNLVEFGERVYGAEAAARHYFGKPASALTPGEAGLLAGSLPNPRKMNPGNPGPYLRSRRDIIVSRMRRWGYMAEASVSRGPVAEPEDAENPDELSTDDPVNLPDATEPAVPEDSVDETSETTEDLDAPSVDEPVEDDPPPFSDEESDIPSDAPPPEALSVNP